MTLKRKIISLSMRKDESTNLPSWKRHFQVLCRLPNIFGHMFGLMNSRIDNDMYSKVDACHNAMEIWKAIEWLKQGESINAQDLEINMYWEFGKFTSRDGETRDSYYSRFYKMMNKLVRNQCEVTNHQVNVQFLLQLKPKWQRSQTTTKNKGKAISNSLPPTYDLEPEVVADDEASSKAKEIDKLTALISMAVNVVGARDNVDVVGNSGPIFDTEPFEKVHNINDNYNVFANKRQHPKQPESVNDTYLVEQGDTNTTPDSSDMSKLG
ncbi:hypothetical protein Tco_0038170 [Tanacetum coccineum]